MIVLSLTSPVLSADSRLKCRLNPLRDETSSVKIASVREILSAIAGDSSLANSIITKSPKGGFCNWRLTP